MNYQGINHVLLVVSDLDRALRFWRDQVGLRPHPRVPQWLMINWCTLHLLTLTRIAGRPLSAEKRFQHVALQVDDLVGTWTRLTGAGLEPFQLALSGEEVVVRAREQLDTGSGTLFVRDPDGNLAEFIEIGRGMFAQEPNPFAA